jgi:hypothetical protein
MFATQNIKQHFLYIWKKEEIKGMKISRNKAIETFWFADNQVILADLEDIL